MMHAKSAHSVLAASLRRHTVTLPGRVRAAAAAIGLLVAADGALAQQPTKPAGPLVSPRPGSTVKAQFGDWKHECS